MTAFPRSPLRSQGPGGTVRDSLASGIRTIDRQRGLGHEGSPESTRRKRGIAASSAVGFRARARPPGTEFLDAETGRQKSPPKWVSAHRDKITGNKGSPQKRAIWRRAGNARFAKTRTWDPLIKSR